MNLFDIENLKEELKNLEAQTNDALFWQNVELSSKISKRINELKSKIDKYQKVNNHLKDITEMNELLQEENEESLEVELLKSLKELQKQIECLEITALLSRKV